MVRNPIEQGYTRREVLVKGAELLGMAAFLAACRGETPPTRIESTATPTPTDREIEPAHLNRLLETLKNSGDPFLGMISDHVRIFRSNTTLPDEFPAWVKRDSTPARIIVNQETASTANTTILFGQNSNESYLLTYKSHPQIKQPPIEWMRLDDIKLAIPTHVSAGGPIEEAMYLAKEWVTHMTNVRIASEFYDVLHGNAFFVTDLQGKPLIDPRRRELAGVTAFSLQVKNNTNDIWRVIDAYPAFLVATTLDGLDQRQITNRQRNRLPSLRVANNTYLNQNVGIKAMMSETIKEWVKAGTFLPPKGITLQAFSNVVLPMIRNFQAHPVNR